MRKGLVSCSLSVGTVSRCCFDNESVFCRGDGAWSGHQKELHILNRTLKRCKDGLAFSANLGRGREVVDELGLRKSKPLSFSATVDGPTRCQGGDKLKPLHKEGKRLYQPIVARLNNLAHDQLDLKCATSSLASAVSSPSLGEMQAAKRVGRYLRKAPVAWQGFPLSRPTARRALVLHGCRLGLTQDFSKVDE